MTATLHKILAGTSYLYYQRQVAAADATDLGTSSLADYYSTRGEAPGTWHGTGLTALAISAGDQVAEDQMRCLFGLGRHPNATAIEYQVVTDAMAKGAKPKDAVYAAKQASRLGKAFPARHGDNTFRTRCAQAYREHNLAHGLDANAAIDEEIRARIRTDVATTMFVENYDRPPLDDRELSGFVARISRPQSAAVAGFDITFSPVKSVSALWAIAPKSIADAIQAAHNAAVDDAIAWLENNATYTRLGTGGVRQVDVEGLVAARFTHRESRAGDPDLHTHMLIANRVPTLDGKWRTLDATHFYRNLVVVSEIYNTRLEHHLETSLGIQFTERPAPTPNKRPIREIIGIPPELIRHWSRRDAAITHRLDSLAVSFQQQLGREPTPKELFALAERATLETRPAKHLSRSYAQQRHDWHTKAATLLGGPNAVDATVSSLLNRASGTRPTVDEAWISRTADEVIAVVSGQRSVWQHHHIRAETERQTRGHIQPTQWPNVVEAVVREALSPTRSLARGDPDITAEPVLQHSPEVLRRRDGTSVYTVPGSQTYTSARRLGTEQRLLDLSIQPSARTLPHDLVISAIDAYNTDPAHVRAQLNTGQTALITHFATSPAGIAVANAPAGTGKTTAMRVLVNAWHASGGTVLGLAPTAAAAAVLAENTGIRVETVDRLLHTLDRIQPRTPEQATASAEFPASVPEWMVQIDDRTLVIVDEHVKLGDDKRLRLFEFLTTRDATIRCLGDDKQLPSIEPGGTDTDTTHNAETPALTEVVRFASPAEARASLMLRDGDPAALGFYLDHQRIHSGTPAAVADKAYTAWFADHHHGRNTLMLATTHDIVTELNTRARTDRLTRTTDNPGPEVVLADGLAASAGDIICTRRNNPLLPVGDNDWVRNGYRWTITTVHPDGSLTATHHTNNGNSGATTLLPADYVAQHVRLGYALTLDSAQGITTDTCHTVLTGRESRNQLYVALTRGIHTNHAYIPTAPDYGEASPWAEPAILPRTSTEVLQHILARDATHTNAHNHLRDTLNPHKRLGHAIDTYLDATGIAIEHTLGPDTLHHIDTAADNLLPGLTDAPAYTVLRHHLATLALTGRDPVQALRTAAAERELDTAHDPAAVLDWRLDTTGAHSTQPGPLPWMPRHSHHITDPQLTEHLDARARIITTLTEQITTDTRTWTHTTAPPWAQPLLQNPLLIAELAVWRAAHHIPDTDLRPTGPRRYPTTERHHQHRLDTHITDALGDLHTATHTWSALAKRIDTRITTDPWWPTLAQHLDTAANAGHDIETLLTTAAAQRPLPDDMPAAALWHRLELPKRAPTDNAEADSGGAYIPSAGSAIESAVDTALPDTADLEYETVSGSEHDVHERSVITDLGL
ncbi:Multifunctional conjugation protein TraI [Nocardia cerradoensis]|uniref:Multifunctional conjugation protein TraI n=1 Tax=Nocardia cerradoensis TaxID=85688 RepID=A0A231GTC0_9NOCA|nr:MobF family relaxase [Nocardia cerradoensis]OXR39869.1 Multifunctional conjugation protein TraI [Nocardia cerradoensis]